MKVPYISSLSVSQALRYSMASAQSQLASSQREVASGKVDDIGLELGRQTGRFVSLKSDMQRLETIMHTNELAASRMSVSQDAIGQIMVRNQDLLENVASGFTQNIDPAILAQIGEKVLSDTLGLLNTGQNGDYIFAGVNTDAPPVADYATGPAKAAFDAAFLGFFGFDKNDPAAQSIDEATMTTFLDTVVEPQFLGVDWTTTMSVASDEGILSRITLTQSAVTSASANEDGFRRTVMAGVITMELFSGNLGAQALNAVADKATELTGTAAAELSNLQGRLGLVEEQVSKASEQIQSQSDLLAEYASSLENVDPYEASVRLTSLLTQIETSYALTARLQQLSLMRFMA
ncbi:MAG: flagellar hook-associated family protein [Rhizobiaceae bacterium]